MSDYEMSEDYYDMVGGKCKVKPDESKIIKIIKRYWKILGRY